MPEKAEYDVIVVGGGNAALCAAISARNAGSSVLVLERAPEDERGGNSTFTDGKYRAVYNGLEDVKALVPDLTEDEIEKTDFGEYTENDFFDDMARITQMRTDPDLCEVLVRNSREALFWLQEQGIRFMANFGRQAYKVNGRFKFWGGTTLVVAAGGPGLVDGLYRRAEKLGVDIRYEATAKSLIHEDGNGVTGVRVLIDGEVKAIRSKAVVLACGGFEANAEWRAKYLGPDWDLAKVRGSRFNTGDGLAMALAIGAQPAGHWSGCHATAWERYASDFGNLADTIQYQRHSYTFGIVVNQNGERFIDEGADFRNYTYAKYGREVLKQPGQAAWQIYDGKVLHLLTDEYRTQAGHQGQGRHDRGARRAARRGRPGTAVEDDQRLQRGGRHKRPVRRQPARRPRRKGAGGAALQLGESARYPALRGLRRDLRHHLHLRRSEDRPWRPGDRHGRQAHSRPVRRRRDGGRAVLPQLSRRQRPDERDGVRSPGRRKRGRGCRLSAGANGVRSTSCPA